MFSTLESNWDQSARRGWTTLATFTMQALGLSLLLLIPLLVIQAPPKLRWFDTSVLTPPPAPEPAPPPTGQRPIHSSNISNGRLLQPPAIPPTIANPSEQRFASSPDVSNLGVDGGTGTARRGVFNLIGNPVDVASSPTPSPPTH